MDQIVNHFRALLVDAQYTGAGRPAERVLTAAAISRAA